MVLSRQTLDIQEALIDVIPFLHNLVSIESPTADQIFSQCVQVQECILESPSVLND